MKRFVMLSPAASSLAPLIRSPDDKRENDLLKATEDDVNLRDAFNALWFVLMNNPIVTPSLCLVF